MLLAALLWTGMQPAFALTEDDGTPGSVPVIYTGEALNPTGATLVPFAVIDERPDPKSATAAGASRIWGSQFNLSLDVSSSLLSGVYFSRSLPLYEALQGNGGFSYPGEGTGLLAFRSQGAEHVLSSGRAVTQKLDYSRGAFQLQGSYLDVDKEFTLAGGGSASVVGDRSPIDALVAKRGMKELQFQAKYQPGNAFALTTSQRRSANEQPGNKEVGMSVDEITHGLVMQLGGGRQFKADYQSRDEDWRDHGAISMRKIAAHLDATSRLALDYSYDSNDIEREGHKEKGRDVTEIKEALVYQLGRGNQLALNYRKFDEEWAGKGPMHIETLAASLQPTSRLQLTYSADSTVNYREGSNEKGLTRDITKQGLIYQLTAQTKLDVNLNQTRESWDRGSTVDVTDKRSQDYALHHIFSGSTKADLVRNLTSVTSGGTTTDIETTSLHFERKPGRLNLVADWLGRSRSDGGSEDLLSFALDSVIGAGRGKTALTGLYKQHAEGADQKQVDTLYRLGLKTAPSQLLQLDLNYESFDQQGPQADHDFVRTKLGMVSQLTRWAKLTGDYSRETDKQVQTQADQGLRLELSPGRLTLTGGLTTQERQGQPDLATTFGDLQIKFGRPLMDWAKAVSGADPLPRASAYGFRGAPAWAGLGDGAITLKYIGRSTDGQPNVVTRSLGYQTMLGKRFYAKLAMHSNPMIKKDNKMVMESARWNTYEGGFDLGNGFATMARFIREEDLNSGDGTRAQVFGLRGAVGGKDLLTFVGGVQQVRPDNAAASDWQFANLNLKFGRPLADWAKTASNTGLFDDNVKYGYRQLPGWAAFADGGLSLQYMSRDASGGDSLVASAVGYQTQIGGRTYMRLSFQQNPLDDKGQVIPVDRKLWEFGRRIGGKFMALARYVSEDSLNGGTSLRTSMLGFRGRLSDRERMETVIVIDDKSYQSGHEHNTTYGLQYAREVGEGHYFIIKGTMTSGDSPSGILGGPDTYQVDFAYKKDI